MAQPGAAKIRAERHCRCCGQTRGGLTAHHLVPQSWFDHHPETTGRNLSANIVPLCHHCHRAIDGNLPKTLGIGVIKLRRIEKRRQLRAHLHEDELLFVTATAGHAWLDEHYPSATDTDDERRTRNLLAKLPYRAVSDTLTHLPGCDSNHCAPGCRLRTRPIATALERSVG